MIEFPTPDCIRMATSLDCIKEPTVSIYRIYWDLQSDKPRSQWHPFQFDGYSPNKRVNSFAFKGTRFTTCTEPDSRTQIHKKRAIRHHLNGTESLSINWKWENRQITIRQLEGRPMTKIFRVHTPSHLNRAISLYLSIRTWYIRTSRVFL